MDLEELVGRARGGDLEAFAEVTRRFQQMAFGYALALLRDLQQAEDVVQEALETGIKVVEVMCPVVRGGTGRDRDAGP